MLRVISGQSSMVSLLKETLLMKSSLLLVQPNHDYVVWDDLTISKDLNQLQNKCNPPSGKEDKEKRKGEERKKREWHWFRRMGDPEWEKMVVTKRHLEEKENWNKEFWVMAEIGWECFLMGKGSVWYFLLETESPANGKWSEKSFKERKGWKKVLGYIRKLVWLIREIFWEERKLE